MTLMPDDPIRIVNTPLGRFIVVAEDRDDDPAGEPVAEARETLSRQWTPAPPEPVPAAAHDPSRGEHSLVARVRHPFRPRRTPALEALSAELAGILDESRRVFDARLAEFRQQAAARRAAADADHPLAEEAQAATVPHEQAGATGEKE